MSQPLPTVPSSWKAIGTTSNTRYFVTDPDLMIVYPHPGSQDDGSTAEENASFQMGYAEKLGRPIGVVVVLTSLTSQNADARRVYAAKMLPKHSFGAALVVEHPLSRAIASFFLGLSKPKIPTWTVDTVNAGLKLLASKRPTGGLV